MQQLRVILMLLLAFLVGSLGQAKGRVIISEFLTVNDKGLVNANGDRSDWIEIRNAGNTMIDLAGWTLTDDAADLAKWTFPAVKIEAGGYLLVFASGTDRSRPDQELHANFRLGAGGEYLGLVKPDGRTVAHHFVMKYPKQRDDVSYGIPADNPFAGRKDGARGEIWAYGLRNVWRMSFDRETGDLWAADVGQNKWEEVNLITKGGNYGWNIRESFHKFKEDGPAKGDWIDPVIEYAHHAGIEKESRFPGHGYGVSITGGYVYHGQAIPALRGAYIYGDFTTGLIFAVRQKDGKATEHGTIHQQKGTVYQIASFGEDAAGEIYLLPLVANPATKRDPAGSILQLVAE